MAGKSLEEEVEQEYQAICRNHPSGTFWANRGIIALCRVLERRLGAMQTDPVTPLDSPANANREMPEAIRRAFTPTAPGDYRSDLLERLKDKAYAGMYLRNALDEGPGVFVVAVRDVMEAQGWEFEQQEAKREEDKQS